MMYTQASLQVLLMQQSTPGQEISFKNYKQVIKKMK